MNWIKVILRIFLGAFFIFSAYSKLDAIAPFDIYIYRSTFLTYDLATILARLVIGFEIIAAFSLLSKVGYKVIWKLTLLFVLIMSGFLLWQFVAGESDNCFCLGELMELSPEESLLKNAILIFALLLVKDLAPLKVHWAIVGLAIVASILTPFIVSPPDIFLKGQFNPADHNQVALDDAISNGEIPPRFIKGKRLLSFYSMNCKYCKMSSERISALVDKHGINKAQIGILFGGTEGNPVDFFEETHSQFFDFSRLHKDPFLKITKGRMPLTLLIDNGKVISEMNYLTIDEEEITRFLNTGL